MLFQSGVRTVMIDRPSRFNAINSKVYQALPQALKEASNDWPRTRVTVLSGNSSSPWYSSGNDLTEFLTRFSSTTDIKNVSSMNVYLIPKGRRT